jgi:SulP family sulfate permease
VLVKSPAGYWQPAPVQPGARTEEGLAVYRFGTSLYYANSSRLIDDVTALVAEGSPLRWMVLDAAAIGDVDYTAAAVLTRVMEHLRQRHIRFAISSALGPVRTQLDRYGITAALDPDAYYDTPGEALDAFHATTRTISGGKPQGENALLPGTNSPSVTRQAP